VSATQKTKKISSSELHNIPAIIPLWYVIAKSGKFITKFRYSRS
jgi:hypothetical protein